MQLNNVKSVSVPGIGKLPIGDKGSTFTVSGKKREHKAGRLAADGGFVESETPAKLEVTIHLQRGVNPAQLNAIVDADVTVRLADGSVHLMSQAFATEVSAVGDGEGKLTLMSNTSEQIS